MNLVAITNASGAFIGIDGMLKHHLETLSVMLNFRYILQGNISLLLRNIRLISLNFIYSYTLLPFSTKTIDDSLTAKGALHYINVGR